MLLGNLDDSGVLSELLSIGTTERRVGLGKDVVLLEVGDELGLRALDGKLDLVGDGLDLGELEELPGSSDVEVGDTNVLDESLVDELGVSLVQD